MEQDVFATLDLPGLSLFATLDVQCLSLESFQNHTKMISKMVVLKMLLCLSTFVLKTDFTIFLKWSETWKTLKKKKLMDF